MNKVASSETTRDKNRLKKLEILLNKNQPKHKINTVDILNLADFETLQEVREILKFGRNSGIGGSQKVNEIFLEVNHFSENFEVQCEEKNISDTIIHTIRSHSYITVQNLKNCYTVNNLTKPFSTLKRETMQFLFSAIKVRKLPT
jgi:predicted P-loop ATPase